MKRLMGLLTGRIVTLFFIVVFSTLSWNALSQTTYYSLGGNWNAAASWSTVGYGSPAAAAIPGANDIVYIGNSRTITINQGVTAVAAIVIVGQDGTSSNLNVGDGTVTNAAATLTIAVTALPGSGDVTVNNGSTIRVGGTDNTASRTSSLTTRNLILNSSSIFVFGDDGNVTNTLNIGGNITIATGSSLTSGGNAGATNLFNLAGNLINDGTLNLTSTTDVSTVALNGSTGQTVGGTGTTFNFHNITLSTSGATNVNLNASIAIRNVLNFNANGLLILGSNNNINLASTASITGFNNNRYIQLDGTSGANGNLIKSTTAATAPWSVTFPIGTSTGGYSPVTIPTITTSPTNGSTLSVKALNSSDPRVLKRTFRLVVTGNSASTTFTNGAFSYNNTTDISSGDSESDYTTVWRLSTGQEWTNIQTIGAPINQFTVAGGTAAAASLQTGTYFYTIGRGNAYPNIWYSYQSGNWNDPTSWTRDGSLVPLLINPSNEIPSTFDKVVITSGRTITMTTSNINIQGIDVIGTLDVGTTTGHNFITINGSGKIKLAGSTDNFPAGTITNFADPSVGGTVELNGTGISLNTNRTFNNLEVNMTGSGNISTLVSNYTLNGNLTVTNGLLQFNDGSTTNRTFTVIGNVTIGNSGGIRVGVSNARHEFNLYGDFTNDGTAYFTQRLAPDYSNEAADGIVDVNMVSPLRDQLISCNGLTRFYRIEINKGVDDTYKATIIASAPGNFVLFGAADYNINTGQAATNNNALGLIYGTVEVGTNVNVLVLNNTGNYAIYQGAQLWVNGGSVTKAAGTAIVPYGKIKVSSGILTSSVGSGITLRDNGVIDIQGGTVNAGAIRTSTNGAGAIGSYIQSGGAVSLTGTSADANYAIFSLTYPGNVFNISGGTLTIQNRSGLGTASARGAIFINSDPANISVTGGTLIMLAQNGTSYRVTSRAPFWNVIMQASGGTRTLELLGTTSGQGTFGVDELSLAIQPLTVLNDFTILSNASFTTNNADVTVSGNFETQVSAVYTPGTNTTTITGTGVSSLIFGNTASNPSQTFHNFAINKTNTSNEVVITTGNTTTAMQVNGTLTVTKGIFDYSTFIVSAKGAVTLASGVTVGKTTSTGKLLFNGTTAQTLSSSSSAIYSMEINNAITPATALTLSTGNLTVYRTLTLTNGVFIIGTNKLTLSGATASISGSGYGVTKMIQTGGNASDGGVELYLDANETLTYPMGVAGKYTPAVATFSSYNDDGLVKIVPVNGILQTTNLTGGADILSYYWRVSTANFSAKPNVVYQFTYDQVDVGGTEANYVPGKVLDVSPFTRSFENDLTKVDNATNVITFNGSGSGFTLEDANYTAGATTRFTGSPRIFYSHRLTDAYAQSWTDGNFWTFATNGAFGVHDSRQPNAGTFPTTGDIAVIGWVPFGDPNYTNGYPHGVEMNTTRTVAEIRFTQMLDVGGNPTARIYFRNFQFRPTLCLNNNGGGNQGQIGTGAKVSGEGMFWLRSTGGNLSDPSFTGVDMGAFNAQDSSYFVYESTINGAVYTNFPSTFPNLIMTTDGWGNQDKDSTIPVNIMVNGNMELLGDINLLLPTGATGDITVGKNLKFFRSNQNGTDSGGGGELRFGNSGTPRTVTVFGNLLLGNGNFGGQQGFVIRIGAPGATPINHTFNLYGDFVQNTSGSNTAIAPNGNGFKAGTSSANDRIHLNLLGSTSMTLTNTLGDVPQFYSLTVSKGSSIATTASFNSNFTIDGPSNAATKSLVLQNGLFKINNASASVVLTSGGGNFNIPGTAGLEVQAGTVSTTTTNTNANITLDGLLRISGGTATIDAGVGFTNYIEYSNSGNAAVEVTGGTLTVGGALRRDLSSTTGVLKYTQSAGTVVLANRGAPTINRGVFEILNTGSQFNHSGGSFTIVQGINSTTVPSLWLEPASSSITSGSTITIGNANTPAGVNSQNIGIKSLVPLNNLTLAGSNHPITKIYISPLTVNGNVTVGTATTLNANNQNLNIGGNLAVNGSYVSTNNTTSFTNTGAAAITGTTPTLDFYNMTKSGGGTLTLGKDININRDLQVLAGTLGTASFGATLKRHAKIDATVSSTGGLGLIFNGTAQQQLTRTTAGTGTLGIVTINNALGVVVPDGNGYNFNITSGLRLQQGVFDIGGSLLFLGTNALITAVNPFSITNMIQTNSSFTDFGVRKQFPLNYTTDFVFPVGQLFYTPVRFNFGTPGNTTGSSGTPTVTVRPANERHPVIVNDDELPLGAGPEDFDDLQNALQYHWIVNADNIAATFRATMELAYDQASVAVTAPRTEADYIAARILSDANPTELINKFTTTEVNETTNVITFTFSGVTDAGISGEYFAGVIDAIPDNVPIYTTNASGDANTAIYTPVVPGGGIPTGAKVIVRSGDNLNFPGTLNNANFYKTEIQPNAILTIMSGSIGHRLGTIEGTGTLRIESNTASAVLPAAIYDDFFSCAGGSLTYGGTGSYDILGGITALRNLTLEGAGTKTLGNNDVTICNNLTVNAGTLSSNNRTINVQNDALMNAGTFNMLTGVLAITRDYTQTAGAFNGGTGGFKSIGRNLTVTNGTFVSGSGVNTIRVDGNMNVANVASFTGGASASNGFRYLFQGTTPQTIAGNFSGTRFINCLEINNSNGLTLAGNVTIERELILTAGNITPGTNTLLMSTTAVAIPAEGRATSFVSGKLYKVIPTTTGFTFPIGKGSLWRSGSVTGLNVAGDIWDMEYFSGSATAEPIVTNMTPVAPILRIASGEYWKVSDGAAVGRTALVGLSWGIQSDVSPNTSEREALEVVRWNNAMTRWDNMGKTNFSAGHTQSRGTFNSSSTLPFTENIVTLGSTEAANPLPVTLVAFNGKIIDNVAELYWKTASELNNDYFELQHSLDGKTFESITRMDGKGTTSIENEYAYADKGLKYGKNYYRLKQVDFNGTTTYHKIIVLTYLGAEVLDFDVFPNPTSSDNINLNVQGKDQVGVRIRMFDVQGKEYYQGILSQEFFNTTIKLNAGQTLKSGMYLIEIMQKGERVVKRIVISE